MNATPEQPQRSAPLQRARAIALWARDTGLGAFGFAVVLLVALSGWAASFIGLHTFGQQHMGLTADEAWLVPLTFDGAPAGLSIVVMRASTHGRAAVVWRLLIIGFTALSSWINYQHIDDDLGRYVAAFMPPSAVILFEGLMSEARAAAKRTAGDRVRPTLHPLRWVFDRSGTLDLYRRYILGLPLPDQMAATATLAARRPAAGSPGRTGMPRAESTASTLPATAAAPTGPAATATPETVPASASARPDATPGTASTAATRQPEAKPAATSSQRPAPTAGAGSDGASRDLDDVARIFRDLRDRLGRAPSDAALAGELGVGRSRAQQLRTAAIDAGHTDLAKPLRAAS